MLCAPPHRITCTFRRNDSIDRQSMETKIRSDFSKRCRKEFDFSLILLYCVLWGEGRWGGEKNLRYFSHDSRSELKPKPIGHVGKRLF